MSSSRHLNAGEGHSDAVLQQGEDTFPPEGNVSKGRAVLVWLLQAEALLLWWEQQEMVLVLYGTSCWDVEDNQPSPTGTRAVLESGISLLLMPFCILGTPAPAAIIMARSWLCEWKRSFIHRSEAHLCCVTKPLHMFCLPRASCWDSICGTGAELVQQQVQAQHGDLHM